MSDRGAPELTLATPEHVPIHFQVADLGSRAVAVIVDLGIQLGLVLGLGLLLSLFVSRSEQLAAIVVLLLFLVRNFYFTFFESRWRGRTPGKRAAHLRVVARDGGPLAVNMLFARNLTRELETFLPLTVLLAPAALLSTPSRWAQIAMFTWVALLTAIPLFNRQRARLGDLLAGTMVVAEPRVSLLEDLVEEVRDRGATEVYVFSKVQLDIYGIRELQVLEDVLRSPPSPRREQLLVEICEKIKTKLSWDAACWEVTPQLFLHDFYRAQRARLEGKMLFGERRERKVR